MPVTNRGSLRTRATRFFVASIIAIPYFGRAYAAEGVDEDTILELNAGYVRAFMTSDATWYDRHLAPDFFCILTNGTVVDRATFLDHARKPHATVSYDLSEIAVRVHGDAALVTALGTWKRTDGASGRTRYIDVWVRKDGVWKTASAQLTAAN